MLVDSIINGIGTAFNIGNSIFNSALQFDNYNYQKRLQNEIFNREDTAVQRRMSDLQKAGLNPNLAAGSSAGTGSVVSTSAPQSDLGNLLDFKSAMTQIKSQQAQTENAQMTNKILSEQYRQEKLKADLELINYANQLGLPVYLRNGSTPTLYNAFGDLELSKDAPINKLFNLNVLNGENSSHLLQKQIDFYNLDKIFGYSAQALSGLGGILKLAK